MHGEGTGDRQKPRGTSFHPSGFLLLMKLC